MLGEEKGWRAVLVLMFLEKRKENDVLDSWKDDGRTVEEKRRASTYHSHRVPTAVTTESPPFVFACMNEQGPSRIIVGSNFLPVGE